MEELLERENMNNQYILIVKFKSTREHIYIDTNKEFLEKIANVTVTLQTLEYARLYKIHYPLTSLVRSWEKEN